MTIYKGLFDLGYELCVNFYLPWDELYVGMKSQVDQKLDLVQSAHPNKIVSINHSYLHVFTHHYIHMKPISAQTNHVSCL